MVTSRKVTLIGTLACVPLAVPLVSFAEEGVRATLNLSSRLETVNESGFTQPVREGERFVTGLNFGLTSENSTQTLGFFADTDIAFNSNDEVADQFEIEDPNLRLNYNLQSRQSALTFSARYRETDIDNSNFFDDFDVNDVETGEGDRTTVTLSTGLVLGREAPITLNLNHLYTTNSFDGQIDDDTSDNTRNRLNTRLSFRLSSVASAYLTGYWNDVDRDDPDAFDQTEQSIGVGTTYALSNVLTFDGQITYDEATSTNPAREDTSGLGFALGLNRALTNGVLGLDLTSTETINGARQQVLVSRSMELPRGALNYGIGATKTGGSSISPLFNIGLDYDATATDRFNVNLRQRATVDDDDDETIRTSLSVGYTRSINEISSISASANYADQNAVNDADDDSSSFTASLTYRHDVGADWDMVTGYEYRTSRRDDEENRNRSTLFVGLEKNFDWRP